MVAFFAASVPGRSVQAQVVHAPTVRSGAMGGAIGLDRPGEVFINPAVAGRASGGEASIRMDEPRQTGAFLSVARDGVALGIQTFLGVENRAGRSEGYRTQSQMYAELQASGALSRRLLGFDVGVQVSLVERARDGDHARAASFGAGVMRDLGRLRLGASVTDLGSDVTAGDASITNDPAYRAQLALETLPVGPLDLAAGAHVGHGPEGWMGGAGVELAYWPVSGRTFRLLAGVRDRPGSSDAVLSVGGSISLDGLTIEYASSDPSNPSHRIGLSWR
jgi:hypothetical protein